MRYLIGIALLALVFSLLTGKAEMPAPSEQDAAIWQELGNTHFVTVGAKEPKNIVYAFIDPNCVYCHKLWETSRPYLQKGLQMRYILVGVLSHTSAGKAVAILEADDPAAALRDGESHYGRMPGGGAAIDPLSYPESGTLRHLSAHLQLMHRLGFHGEPVILFLNSDGELRSVEGMPRNWLYQRKMFGVDRLK